MTRLQVKGGAALADEARRGDRASEWTFSLLPTVLHLNMKVIGFVAKYIYLMRTRRAAGVINSFLYSFCFERLACSHANNYACLFLFLQFYFWQCQILVKP
jgi:hypothetical protein